MLKKLITLSVALCMALSLVQMSCAESGESTSLVNIIQGKEVYSPFTVNKDGEAAKLIDGKLDTKWCSKQFQTADNNADSVFVMIKMGSAAVKACGFRLYNSSLNEGEFTSIWEFKIYTTNDDSMWNKAKNSDFKNESKFTQVYDSVEGLVPISSASKYDTQAFIDSPVWPLPKGVTYDPVAKSHFGIIKDMIKAGTDLGTYEKFKKTFDAKYVVFQVTRNMDSNPRVPELMIFQSTGTTSVVTSSSKVSSQSSKAISSTTSSTANVSSSTESLNESGLTSESDTTSTFEESSEDTESLMDSDTSSTTSQATDGTKNLTWLWIVLGVVAVGGIGAAIYFLVIKKR